MRIKNTTCTIEPSTIIAGLNPQTVNGVNPGTLVIEKDAKIIAKGTADDPVIFTSKYMVDGSTAITPLPGDFGGLIIIGQSYTYRSRAIYLAGAGLGEAPVEIPYGGTNEDHSSGQLQQSC
ncbi:MAG: hypothetical protein EOP51_11990 [Sphingobacteriales bacterium]|nr:MAG: hypothetical protein EOP51_11990 [Sphingobacteriales bacterium]